MSIERISVGQLLNPPQVSWTGVANPNDVGGHEIRVVSNLRIKEDDGERLFVAWEHSLEEWRGSVDALGEKQWQQGLIMASALEHVVKGLVMGIVDHVGLPSVDDTLVEDREIAEWEDEVFLKRRLRVVEDGKLVEVEDGGAVI